MYCPVLTITTIQNLTINNVGVKEKDPNILILTYRINVLHYIFGELTYAGAHYPKFKGGPGPGQPTLALAQLGSSWTTCMKRQSQSNPANGLLQRTWLSLRMMYGPTNQVKSSQSPMANNLGPWMKQPTKDQGERWHLTPLGSTDPKHAPIG